MTDEPEQQLDVAGQPGGPSPDEQAQVDAEQLALIEQVRATLAPMEEAERLLVQAKLDKAAAAMGERRDLIEAVRALTARVELLEAKR